MLLVCCCAGIIGGALIWGKDIYDQVGERTRRTVGLNEPGRDGNLEFRVLHSSDRQRTG